jgi:hypothetical protein
VTHVASSELGVGRELVAALLRLRDQIDVEPADGSTGEIVKRQLVFAWMWIA